MICNLLTVLQKQQENKMVDLFNDSSTNNLFIIGNGFDLHHCLETLVSLKIC